MSFKVSKRGGQERLKRE